MAISALRKVIHDFGGTAAQNYTDRKVRWSKMFFSSSAYIPGGLGTSGLTPPSNLAQWGGISDTPNTPYLLDLMQNTSANGGTRYDNAFTLIESHLKTILANDPQPKRKTAVIFTTDGYPNEGCNASPPIVSRIYNMPDPSGNPRQIKSYIVGFGSGLGSSGMACLSKLATAGHTDTKKCNSGTCLTFYAADSAADLSNALQDIVNQATQEVCDGLDNDCDGQIDNNTVDACSCVMSYARPTPTTSVNPLTTEYKAGVRLYTFIASFDVQGKCPPAGSANDKAIKAYWEACRNDPMKATSCTPNKTTLKNPAGRAYGILCKRCCGNGSAQNTCSWPTTHACGTSTKPWGATACISGCINFCKKYEKMALDCNVPRGIFMRSGTGYDAKGNLTVLTVKDFGEEVLNIQTKRWIFINLPN
ncbi:MAG: hypothetical protein D6706_07735, partial [Chloroflexi bacterium]